MAPNIKGGLSRLAVLPGVGGLLFGLRLSLQDFSYLSDERAEHFRFERLAAALPSVPSILKKANDDLAHGLIPDSYRSAHTSVVCSKGACALGESDKTTWSDRGLFVNAEFNRLPDSDQQQIASQKIDPRIANLDAHNFRVWRDTLKATLGLPNNLACSVSVNRNGVTSVNISEGRIDSLESVAGETIYDRPLPSFGSYALDAVAPFVAFGAGYALGFCVPWGVLSGASWIISGFRQKPRITTAFREKTVEKVKRQAS